VTGRQIADVGPNVRGVVWWVLGTWLSCVFGVVLFVYAGNWAAAAYAVNSAICAAGWYLAASQWAAWKHEALTGGFSDDGNAET